MLIEMRKKHRLEILSFDFMIFITWILLKINHRRLNLTVFQS